MKKETFNKIVGAGVRIAINCIKVKLISEAIGAVLETKQKEKQLAIKEEELNRREREVKRRERNIRKNNDKRNNYKRRRNNYKDKDKEFNDEVDKLVKEMCK